jgi:predicted alpha/beta superfamily hydrolase
MLKYAVLFVALLTCFKSLPAWAQSKVSQVSNSPEYVLTGTQLREVRSDILNQDYQLMISLPDGYSSESNNKYPVIYVLDGQWDFALVSSIYGKLHYDGDLPEAIVVGITWGGENPDVDKLRARDFIPQSSNTAGAKLFLNVLEKELLPYVDAQFNTNKQRALTGTSYGGLFTTYAMLENPNLFDGYIALSAAYHAFPETLMQQQLAKLSAQKGDKALWFYLGCGSKDGCASSSPEFANTLTTMQLTDLHVKLKMEEGIGHASITPISVTFGLQFVFERSLLSKVKSFFTSD